MGQGYEQLTSNYCAPVVARMNVLHIIVMGGLHEAERDLPC
jgi:hypothetical protein